MLEIAVLGWISLRVSGQLTYSAPQLRRTLNPDIFKFISHTFKHYSTPKSFNPKVANSRLENSWKFRGRYSPPSQGAIFSRRLYCLEISYNSKKTPASTVRLATLSNTPQPPGAINTKHFRRSPPLQFFQDHCVQCGVAVR